MHIGIVSLCSNEGTGELGSFKKVCKLDVDQLDVGFVDFRDRSHGLNNSKILRFINKYLLQMLKSRLQFLQFSD